MGLFGKLNQLSVNPHISAELNQEIINYIFSQLGTVKAVSFEDEDGSTPCEISYFMEVLNGYSFQEAEVANLRNLGNGGELWLADGDARLLARF